MPSSATVLKGFGGCVGEAGDIVPGWRADGKAPDMRGTSCVDEGRNSWYTGARGEAEDAALSTGDAVLLFDCPEEFLELLGLLTLLQGCSRPPRPIVMMSADGGLRFE